MKVDEQDRQSLRERLDTVLGEYPAEVLMGMLEGIAGQDLATRDDVLAIGTRLDGIGTRLDQMDRRLDQMDRRLDKVDTRFESRIAEQTRMMVFTGVGIAMSTWALLFAALGFA